MQFGDLLWANKSRAEDYMGFRCTYVDVCISTLARMTRWWLVSLSTGDREESQLIGKLVLAGQGRLRNGLIVLFVLQYIKVPNQAPPQSFSNYVASRCASTTPGAH